MPGLISLKNYWVSEAHYEGSDLSITLSPEPLPKYTAKIHGKESIEKLLNLMKDRNMPVRDFMLSDNCIMASPGYSIEMEASDIHCEGK